MARNDDDEGSVMLLVTTRDESDYQEKWYLDTGCLTAVWQVDQSIVE
ncbi:hypothetical protein A2U01_0118034 [Trifolium medium]|uniref:Uncharacterized protein n=1 Tax=Trifolium medium TaxID=97028 RepID=A0A392W7W6_9FABA|nr:hypothetical protein [Trifolium medium]